MSLYLALFLLLPAAPAVPLASAAVPAPPRPRVDQVHLSAPAFGGQVEIEVRGLPKALAEAAIQEAFQEVATVERTTDPESPGGGIAALNSAAGAGPQAVEAGLSQALSRALDFCFWTEGAVGPLGRDLYRLWGLRTPAEALPDPTALETAIGAANCSGLNLDPKKRTATLAAGAGLDLWSFAEGAAVDRAVEVLRQRKVPTGLVQIGGVRRGFGAGPNGKGWRVVLPVFAGLDQPLGEVWLHDRALAVATSTRHPLRIGGDLYPPYLNQRTGKPSSGVLAALAASEIAVDAQALSATAMVLSPHEAQLRLGALRPQPAILWILGTGQGVPLLLDYRWSEVPKK
jgi:FAD:protein FMN transferase